MNNKLITATAAATSIVAGTALAAVAKKIVVKHPKLEKPLNVSAGFILGVGTTFLVSGTVGQKLLVTKSEAASILASGD